MSANSFRSLVCLSHHWRRQRAQRQWIRHSDAVAIITRHLLHPDGDQFVNLLHRQQRTFALTKHLQDNALFVDFLKTTLTSAAIITQL